jgi:repressor LexA
MKKEDYVKMLITSSGHTVKSFAESINLPYTTLLGMLKRGLGGASVHNAIKVCRGLSITVEDLLRVDDNEEAPIPFHVTDHEKKLLTRYREKPEMKPAIDTLLGIEAGK